MLELGYISLTILMLFLLCFIGIKAINATFDKTTAKRKRLKLIAALLLWQVYIFALASTDILQNFDFPPRFVLFMILPLFLFTGFFVYKNRNNAWIQNIPPHWLIYYQSFRVLVESLFVFTVAKGILSPIVTIEGYNYDMVFAFTAPIIAFLVFQKKIFSKKVAITWNFLGLAVISVIIFLFQTTIYFPEIYGSDTILMPKEFTFYPYVLVAGFLMPSAVFVHVLSIAQLMKRTDV